ncbi:hypothetical protein BH23CHL5_BH23CHL5_28330 [soil metagenome]
MVTTSRERVKGFLMSAKTARVSVTEFAETHYKIPSLIIHGVRCGKLNCKCSRSQHRHGPYAYLYWRDGLGKAHRLYVRKAEVEQVRGIIELRQMVERERRQLRAQSRDYLSFLNAMAKRYGI